MQTFSSWGLRVSIIVFAILHFFTYFYENELLLQVLSLSGFGILLFAIFTLSIRNIKLPFALFLIGIVILLVSGGSLVDALLEGFLEMRNMVGLLVIIPLVSWVLREEDYLDAILRFFHKALDTSRKFYFGIASFIQVIAYFLLFGSISMVYQFVNTILKNERGEAWENFKGTALLRGFALSVMWVVSIPSFAYAVEVMNAPLGISILQGMAVAFCGIIVAVIFSYFEEKKYGVDLTAGIESEIETAQSADISKKQTNRLVIEFAALFISLFGTIFLLQGIVNIELLVLIPLVVVAWIIVYYLVKRKPSKLAGKAKDYVLNEMNNRSYQLNMMLGAGMMIFALNQTGFAPFIANSITALEESIPFLNALYFLPLLVIILGFFGLGPLTVMALVGGILGSMELPYPPELIVLAITSGSAISILLSPLIMPVIMLSGENKLSAFKNGIQFNWKFALVIYVMVQIYVQLRIW